MQYSVHTDVVKSNSENSDLKEYDSQSLDKIVSSNTNLVKIMVHRHKISSLPYQDALQEGVIGLLKSLQTYDSRKGKVGTHAYYFILNNIARANRTQGNVVRVPENTAKYISKVFDAERVLFNELARSPSLEEISIHAKISVNEVTKVKSLYENTVSLDQLQFENQRYIDNLVSEDSIDISEQIFKEQSAKLLPSSMNELSSREKEIISSRFKEHPEKLEELAVYYGISHERVRQIQVNALEKLRKIFESNGISKEDFEF